MMQLLQRKMMHLGSWSEVKVYISQVLLPVSLLVSRIYHLAIYVSRSWSVPLHISLHLLYLSRVALLVHSAERAMNYLQSTETEAGANLLLLVLYPICCSGLDIYWHGSQ